MLLCIISLMETKGIGEETVGQYLHVNIPGDGKLIVCPDRRELVEEIVTAQPWKNQNFTNEFQKLGHRRSYPILLPSGFKIVVKPKIGMKEYKYFRDSVLESELPDKSWSLAIGRAASSVRQEIALIDNIRNEWRNLYGSELTIEKPVGGFISEQGKKYVFFEFIPDEIPLADYTPEMEKERQEWENDTVEKIRGLGVEPIESDAIIVKDDSIKKYHFVLVDEEKWIKSPVS